MTRVDPPTSPDPPELGTCALCGGEYDGWGANPEPLAAYPARCCARCDEEVVIPERIFRLTGQRIVLPPIPTDLDMLPPDNS